MITLKLNGQDHPLDVTEDMPLLWAIRDVAGYNGTKFGCGMGLCGACTIHIDGLPARSCITPIGSVVGQNVTTIDNLHADPVGQVVQQAWLDSAVAQCGFCQGGQIMSATALLKPTPIRATSRSKRQWSATFAGAAPTTGSRLRSARPRLT